MKPLTLLTVVTAVIFAFFGDASMSSRERSMSPNQSVLAQSKPRFSSLYTSLTSPKCGSGMTKQQERAAEEQASDIPTRCKGYGGYYIFISYSACTSEIQARKGAESFQLASQGVNWKQKTVEWRMARAYGKTVPFAVIMRVYKYAGDDHCATNGRTTGEFLIVKGLEGFEHIDEKIDMKTPNANLKARQLADQKYGMTLKSNQ
ncbi:MAG TPA: hypothetical protein VNO50_01945 [Pyrinomonadaceae bacterium]|nr:hypothetical protein [Pyrinomonadaceae bacterium]